MEIIGINAELVVDWIVRDLPAAALREVGRRTEADLIMAQPPVTRRAVASRTGMRHYQPPLQRAALEMDAVVAVLEPDNQSRQSWEVDVRMDAEIGAAIMTVVRRNEFELTRRDHHAGYWAVRAITAAVQLSAYLNPGAVAQAVQQSYQNLYTTAVLDGWGRLRVTETNR